MTRIRPNLTHASLSAAYASLDRLRFGPSPLTGNVSLGPTLVEVTDGSDNAAFPGLVYTDGQLIGIFRRAANHNPVSGAPASPPEFAGVLHVTRSTDLGHTWSPSVGVISDAGGLDCRDPMLTVLSDGRLAVQFFKHNGTVVEDVFVSYSADLGATWTTPQALPFTESQPASSGRIVEPSPGVLVAACYSRPDSSTSWAIKALRSTDNGATWGGETTVMDGRGSSVSYTEPVLGILPGGDIMCLARNDSAAPDTITRSVSTDDGLTWSAPTGVVSGSGRPAWRALDSGAVVLVYRQEGTDGNRPALVSTSWDDGLTWTAPGVLTAAAFESAYADLVEMEPGLVAVMTSREDSRPSATMLFGYLGDGPGLSPLGEVLGGAAEDLFLDQATADTLYQPKAGQRIWLSAKAFDVLDGTPNIAKVSSRPAYHLDAAANEQIAATYFLPPGWATYNVDLYWTNPAAGTGDVMWQFVHASKADAGNLTTGDSTAALVTVAAPASSILKVTRLASTVAASTDAMAYTRIFRVGTNAADTLPNDAAFLGVLLTRVS